MSQRLSINQELKNMRSRITEQTGVINFQKVINKQTEVIRSLQEEIWLLKSYISLQTMSLANLTHSTAPQKQFQEVDSHQNMKSKQYQSFMKILAEALELSDVKSIDQTTIIATIKQMKEALSKKKEPIFIERVKQIKVPITIEKIVEKPVEKIIEKIVYVDRPTVVFKQKIVQKFIERKEEPSLNTSFSEKTLKIPRQEKQYNLEQQKYSSRNYQADYHRRPQFGTNLIKKRENGGKYYAPKRDAYQKDYY